MTYNSEREDLIIPEYGRHIQELVNHCLGLQDRNDRNQFAEAIIDVMGRLNPHLRDVPDFQHKLWDQLFIMSNFALDVDSPFPKPTAEITQSKPNRIPYPKAQYKYRYYGQIIQNMIESAKEIKDKELQEGLVYSIANQMKKAYINWNKEQVNDTIIFNHLKELSKGYFDLTGDFDALIETSKVLSNKVPTTIKRRKGRKKKN